MTAYQLLLNQGEIALPAGTASIVVAAAPLVSVAVAAAGLGERISRTQVAGGVVALGGVSVVCLSRSAVSLSASVLIVVAATVAQGLYHPLTKSLLRRHTGLEVVIYAMVAGTVTSLPLLPWAWPGLAGGGATAWACAGYLGLLPSALGFVLWGHAVRGLPVVASTSLLYLVPVVAVGIAFAWLGEVPTAVELAGGGVVLAGVLLANRRRPVRPGGSPAAPAVSPAVSPAGPAVSPVTVSERPTPAAGTGSPCR